MQKKSEKQNSLIIPALTRFTLWLYSCLRNGFFGTLFSSYDGALGMPRAVAFLIRRSEVVRRTFTRWIDHSLFSCIASQAVSFFLRCRLKVYGVTVVTFGAYSVLSVIFTLLVSPDSVQSFDAAVGLVLAVSSIPLLLSNETLSGALSASSFGKLIREVTGAREESMTREGSAGRTNIGFIVGVILGILSFFFSPLKIIAVILLLILFSLILHIPEFGVVSLFFFAPFLPTMVLVVLVLFTFCSFAVKLIRGKRVIHPEKLDAAVFVFFMFMLFGGLCSFSPSSIRPALVFCTFILSFFLVVYLINSAQWLKRCAIASVVSCALVSLYGIITYFFSDAVKTSSWIDSEMFVTISGRAVSTLENPNMLAEYLILIFPLALSMFAVYPGVKSRLPALVAILSIGSCLIFTWSRGAWLGLIVAMVVYFIGSSRKSLYFFFFGVLALPFLPAVLPESVINRFMSIGNTADSSTMYRVGIWRGAGRMIKDFFFQGIGIGEGAWSEVYPSYSLPAIEAAPHAHNVYMQILIEVGIFGLIALAVCLFLLSQSTFSYIKRLSDSDAIISHFKPGVSCAPQEEDNTVFAVGNIRMRIGSTTSLRLEAIAPFCGIIGALTQGFTDYIWYNYRVFLVFWLMFGLASAYARLGNREILDIRDGGTLKLTPTASDGTFILKKVPPVGNEKESKRRS